MKGRGVDDVSGRWSVVVAGGKILSRRRWNAQPAAWQKPRPERIAALGAKVLEVWGTREYPGKGEGDGGLRGRLFILSSMALSSHAPAPALLVAAHNRIHPSCANVSRSLVPTHTCRGEMEGRVMAARRS